MNSAPPPSEPYRRISRIRLSGRWCDLKQDGPTSPRRGQSLAGFSKVSPPYFHPRRRIVHMRNFDSDRFLCLATAEAAPTRLAQGHSRRFEFDLNLRYSSTFLRSLRSLSITRVPRYYGRSDSCRPGSSAPVAGSMNTVSGNQQVSLIHVSDLPIPPSPTTPQALDADFARYPSSHRVSHSCGSRLHLCLAGSPTLTGRIEFVILRMDRSPPVAPHPASRRRSCLRLTVPITRVRRGLSPPASTPCLAQSG